MYLKLNLDANCGFQEHFVLSMSAHDLMDSTPNIHALTVPKGTILATTVDFKIILKLN